MKEKHKLLKGFEEQFLDLEITLNKIKQLKIPMSNLKFGNQSIESLEKEFSKKLEKLKVVCFENSF